MKHINVPDFKQALHVNKSDNTVDFIDVCTPVEYKDKHIAGMRNVPLDELEARKGEFLGKETIYVNCRSGNRSQQAIEKLKSLGVTATLINLEGGILAWEEQGLATKSLGEMRIPLMRQVLIAAGALILIGFFGQFVHSLFSIISLVVGSGLLFAGLTGWCGMAFLLARAPWNK